jgi:hypothetical protein
LSTLTTTSAREPRVKGCAITQILIDVQDDYLSTCVYPLTGDANGMEEDWKSD